MRWLLVPFAAMALFLTIHFPWTHAALAATAADTSCGVELKSSSERTVAGLYGSATDEPIFVCLKGTTLGLSVSHGSTSFAPFLPTIVVLGPAGQNDDVAAHERAHAELAARTSVLLRTLRLPTWFDEGLAMQVDHRPDYSREALRNHLGGVGTPTISLASLGRPSSFYKPGRQGKLNYAFSRCVVGAWRAHYGPGAPGKLIEDIGWRSTFPTSDFVRFEPACRE